METIEFTFLPLGRALAEFYRTLAEVGVPDAYASNLTAMVLKDVLEDGRWGDPPVIRLASRPCDCSSTPGEFCVCPVSE